jgi:hypothetical protein
MEWVGWIERDCGLIGGIFGARKKVEKEVCEMLEKVLVNSDKVSELRWHFKEDFDRGIEETASTKL